MVVKINNLEKKFRKFKAVDIDKLTVEAGKFYGFVGPNGAGKSTTINMMLNFISPTKGTIEIFNLDVQKDIKQLNTKIGYVPSETNFPNIKVKELIKYNKRFYHNVDQKYVDYLVKELKIEMHKNIHDLSLGNRKKVAIVIALMHKPELIILDEPTSGLDPLMQKKFFTILAERKNEGATIFMSSHVLTEVESECDVVYFIKNGKIIDFIDIKNHEKALGYNYRYINQENKFISGSWYEDEKSLLEALIKDDATEIEIIKETITDKFKYLYEEE